MSHLSIERLAALADEQPSADESSHLAQCAECTRELEAIRSLVTLAGAERSTMNIPLTRWSSLAKSLRAEGLIATPGTGRVMRPASRFSSRAMLQLAAALLLVAGGIGAGRMSAGASLVPGGVSGTELASNDSVHTTFASTAEAAKWQELYGNGYQRALEYLANHDASSRAATPAAMRTRLSALDRMQATVRQALNDAPADPVINDFYVSTFAQREATLRQLTASLPPGARLNSF